MTFRLEIDRDLTHKADGDRVGRVRSHSGGIER